VPHRLDHLVDDEAAELLGPFLPAGEGHQLLMAAGAATDPGKARGKDAAAIMAARMISSAVHSLRSQT